MSEPRESERPYLRVVRGNPSDEELAALTAVVATLGTDQAEEPAPRRSAWADPTRLVRRPLPHGPGAWRASGLPG
ncbi:acyl-CoA carboxylase subunit epsilon [Saccharothrix variisporea]|uniref:Acyl-CoA carboxylase epsilon subunit-like protein n=1 Tax=Saccharothrix variisporea TaxID=543527 RepID=A0A495XHY1_9PSEU|nr:acyl-CoA carboxylase subunit epsilon [Saccharothrix variisporea]RKT72364.1 acyl-CoA carboxylase epsilon subunit-like protein [Saccharothrix variisporea]